MCVPAQWGREGGAGGRGEGRGAGGSCGLARERRWGGVGGVVHLEGSEALLRRSRPRCKRATVLNVHSPNAQPPNGYACVQPPRRFLPFPAFHCSKGNVVFFRGEHVIASSPRRRPSGLTPFLRQRSRPHSHPRFPLAPGETFLESPCMYWLTG